MILVRPGRFEVFRDQNKQYRFRLRASNGLVLLSSTGYKTRKSALTGVESVRKNCTDAAHFQRQQTPSGYCFDLLAQNKKVIGTGEFYTSSRSRERGIASVQRHAPNAKITEV